jgi:hypothetical protein
MDRMLDDLAGLFLGLAILLIFGALAALIYFCVAYVIYRHRLGVYRQQAEADFEQEAARLGIDLDADEIFRSAYGVGVDLPNDGYDNVGEWAAGTLFGVEAYEEVA